MIIYRSNSIRCFALLFALFGAFICAVNAQSSLNGKRIYIDPGHGGTAATDMYRVGKYGEREEWINLRVALLLKQLLTEKGAIVFLTREADDQLELRARAKLARDSAADVFISIHHNATADTTVNFPIIYYHGAASENKASVLLGKYLATAFQKQLFSTKSPVSLVSDYTIFPEKGAAVLRETYGIPGLLCEASFFTNAKEEMRLKSQTHNLREARAYVTGLEQFFRLQSLQIAEKKIPFELPPFPVLQEADRMKPEAFAWLSDFQEGKRLMRQNDKQTLLLAYDLFTRSARSFPDSYVARQCHLYRAQILATLERHAEAAVEKTRAAEFFVIP